MTAGHQKHKCAGMLCNTKGSARNQDLGGLRFPRIL